VTPEGWPKGSSIIKGTLASYKMLKLSPKFWSDDFLQKLESISTNKSLHIVRSVAELNRFVEKNTSIRK
jgi:hypothetical protein